MTRLFVYGTLMRGQKRAELLNGQKFLDERKTKLQYRLFSVNGEFPALVRADRSDIALPGVSVEGELWQVDEDCLQLLDMAEGVGSGLFERRLLELSSDLSEAQAYFWMGSVEGLEDCEEL